MGKSTLKACIVGAGPAGLAVARTLRRFGIAYDQFDRHGDVGGIWDRRNPGTPMYRSAHFISSRTKSAYIDFAMPESFPDYPRHDQILAYVRSFADAYGLRDGITFNTEVKAARRAERDWEVELSDGRTETYRWLICVNGHTWDPAWPAYPGSFDGETMHAVDYDDPAIFRGRRVLLVGAGNSACDIACDAAQNADAAHISMRRGYHFVPKHLFGKPADVMLGGPMPVPKRIAQGMLGGLLRLLNGDLTRYGLQKPDHRILESHPIVNSQLIHHLTHGDIRAHHDIARFEGSTVRFNNGETIEADLIVYATGYRYSIPYLEDRWFDWDGYKPRLAYGLFPPKADNVFCAGFFEMNAGGWHTYDQMAFLIAQAIEASPGGEFEAEVATKLHRLVDLSGGLSFVDSDRHRGYVDAQAYQGELAKLCSELGWRLPSAGDFPRPRDRAGSEPEPALRAAG